MKRLGVPTKLSQSGESKALAMKELAAWREGTQPRLGDPVNGRVYQGELAGTGASWSSGRLGASGMQLESSV